MAHLIIVRPGAGSPGLLTLEAWQAISRGVPLVPPGDSLAARLREADVDVEEVPEAEPALVLAPREAASAGVTGEIAPGRRLPLATHAHAHAETPPGAAALAARLVGAAIERGEAVFVAPSGADHAEAGEAIVRAVLERALAGDVEVEIVIGRPSAGHRLLDLVAVMARLRAPGGCPWDREQTHASLARYLLDETYELLEAIESGTPAHVEEELGDLLLQVVFHSEIAAEAGGFDIDDVAGSLVDKLVKRHPHVFGDVVVSGAGEVVANWDVIKRHEKQRESALEGVPEALPALAYAQKILRRAGDAAARAAGRDPAARAREAMAAEITEESLGEVLLLLAAAGRRAGVDAESALRRAARRLRDRIVAVERDARAAGKSLGDLTPGELAELWARR